MLLSSGLTTPELEANFRGMLRESAAGAEPCITMVVTAQMAPSNEADPPSECKPTSAGEKRRRRWYEARKKGRLLGAQLGVEVHCIDCAQTQGTDLEQELEGAHCIWVTGGNTFFLLQHMRSSGLDRLIRGRLAAGALYVGCSAGAIVAGRSAATAMWKGWDDPAAATETDWSDPASLQGLGLAAEHSFFPHYDPQWAELVRSRLVELDHSLVCLEDLGEAFVSPPELGGADSA